MSSPPRLEVGLQRERSQRGYKDPGLSWERLQPAEGRKQQIGVRLGNEVGLNRKTTCPLPHPPTEPQEAEGAWDPTQDETSQRLRGS